MRPIMLFAFAFAFAFVANVAAAGEARQFGQIGVLNLEQVFNEAKIYTSRRDELKGEMENAKAKLADVDKTIRAAETDLAGLNRADRRAIELGDQVELQKLQRKQFLERIQNGLEARQVAILKSSHGIIREHLQQFCIEKGIKLVHLAPTTDLNAPTMPDLQLQLGLQAVLFYDAGLDITEPFVSYVNGKFAEDQGKLSAAATPTLTTPAPATGSATAAPAPATPAAPNPIDVAPAAPAPAPAK